MKNLLLLVSLLVCNQVNAQLRWKSFDKVPSFNWNWNLYPLTNDKVWINDLTYNGDTILEQQLAEKYCLVDKLTGQNYTSVDRKLGVDFGSNHVLRLRGIGNFNPDIVCLSYDKKYLYTILSVSDTTIPNWSNYIFKNYLQKIDAQTGLPVSTKQISQSSLIIGITSVKMLAADTIALATSLMVGSPDAGPRTMGFTLLDTNGNVLFADSLPTYKREVCNNAVMDINKNSYLCGISDTIKTPPQILYGNKICDITKVDRYGKRLASQAVTRHAKCEPAHIMSNGHQFTDGIIMSIAACSRYTDWEQWNSKYTQWLLGWYDTTLTLLKSDSILRSDYSFITVVKPLQGKRQLIVGCATKDTFYKNPGFDPNVYGIATVIDSNGKVIWDRKYNFRDGVEHYFASAEQDTDGSIYISGMIFNNATEPRASILLRLDSMGCFDASCAPMDVVEIEALQNSDITISPNPASDRVQIDLRDENFAGGFLQIYTANGQKLSRVALHSQHHSIDITSWPSGIYYVSYEHKKYFYKGKLVVQH